MPSDSDALVCRCSPPTHTKSFPVPPAPFLLCELPGEKTRKTSSPTAHLQEQLCSRVRFLLLSTVRKPGGHSTTHTGTAGRGHGDAAVCGTRLLPPTAGTAPHSPSRRLGSFPHTPTSAHGPFPDRTGAALARDGRLRAHPTLWRREQKHTGCCLASEPTVWAPAPTTQHTTQSRPFFCFRSPALASRPTAGPNSSQRLHQAPALP